MQTAITSVFVIFKKDIQAELRTRYALNALVMFVITTLAVILFSIGNENVSPELLAGILWIIIFFSSMSGLSRTFISEEEKGTVLTLHLLVKPLTVYFAAIFSRPRFGTSISAGLWRLSFASWSLSPVSPRPPRPSCLPPVISGGERWKPASRSKFPPSATRPPVAGRARQSGNGYLARNPGGRARQPFTRRRS